MKQYYIIFFILTLGLFSCNKEKIDTPLQIYVDNFFIEAEKRGIQLSRKKLEVVFNDDLSSCGIGYSDFNEKGKRRVEINMNSFCWQEKSTIQKELLMFHELGHAILERGHDNRKLPNGMFASIMTEGDIQHGLYTEYSLELRDYYLNELFNSDEPIPEWAKLKTNKSILFSEDFELPSDNWKFSIFPEEAIDKIKGVIELNEEGNSKVAKIVALDFLNTNGLYGWYFDLQPPNLTAGGILQLNAKISTKNLGRLDGAELSIVAGSWDRDSTISSIVFSNSDEKVILDNQEGIYSARIGYYPNSVKRIAINLNMRGSVKGEIEFDDIELVYYE